MSGLKRVKIQPAIDEFLATDTVQQFEPSTKYNYERCLAVLVKVNGNRINAYELRPAHINATLNELRKYRSEKSLNNDRAILKAFVTYLHRHGMLSRYQDPMADIKHHYKRGSEKPLHEMILTPDQATVCFAAASEYHPRERVMLALGMYACMRESEICDLKWGDVEGVDGMMQFYRRKQNTWLRLPKFPVLENELNTWRIWLTNQHGQIDPEWYVIPSRIRSPGGPALGQKVNPTWPVMPTRKVGELSRTCHTIYKLAGCDHEDWGVHTLRRTGACMWLAHLGDIRAVQAILGHSSVTTTEGYVQYVNGMDKVFAAAGTFDPLGMADMATPLAPVTQTGEPSNVVAFRPRKAG